MDRMFYLIESCGFVRTLIPLTDDSADSNLYIGTTKNLVMEGYIGEKFSTVIQVRHEQWPNQFSNHKT